MQPGIMRRLTTMTCALLGTRGRVLGGIGLAVALLCTTTASNAADRKVLAEDFNATWCGPCINVGLAISQLLDNYPDSYIAMQVHQADSYTISWGNQRANFYSVAGYPTVWTDGVLLQYGSVGSVSANYNNLNAYRQQRLGVPTDVTIQLGGEQQSGQTYSFTAVVGIEDGGEAKTLRVYLAQLLDHYPNGGHYRNCLIQASQSYTFTLQPGEIETINHNFTLSGASWQNQEDIRIIAWAQEPSSSGPAEIYQAEMMSWPFTSLDCNDNGIPDPQEIAEGLSLDCNGNGRPDECDIDSGEEDCDENGVLDTCEVRSEYVVDSGDLGLIGEGYSQQYTIEDPIEQFEPVVLTVHGFGDFSTFNEYVEVWLNGELIGTAFEDGGADCTALDAVIEISAADFNFLTDGQDAVFDFISSPEVLAERCDGSSSISVEVEYWAPGSDADQNANGIPDACEELSCPADLDDSGAVDVADLLQVLGFWGQSDVVQDLDGSGTVEVGDLLIVLGAWGDC
jgi:thiol-disulfide isomerase/thioredoxin